MQRHVALVELSHRARLAVEELNREHADDLFLEQRVQRGVSGSDLAVRAAQSQVHVREGRPERGNRAEHPRRQTAMQREHRDDHAGQHHSVRRRPHDALGDESLDGLNVAGQPRHEPSHGRAIEERHVEPEDLAVETGAQLVDHALADAGRQQAFDEPKAEGGRRQREEHAAVPQQPLPADLGRLRQIGEPSVHRAAENPRQGVDRGGHGQQEPDRERERARVRPQVASEKPQDRPRRPGRVQKGAVGAHGASSRPRSMSWRRARSR